MIGERSAASGNADRHENQQPSAGGLVNAEMTLLGSLKDHFGQSFKENLQHNWPTLLVEGGVSLVAGAAVAAVTKNPALIGRTIGQILKHENPLLLGEQMTKFVVPAVKAAPYVLGAAATVDVGHRLGAPAWDLMLHPDNLQSDIKLFNNNASSLVQDYTVSAAGGLAGAKFAWGRTAPYVNRGPEVDFSAQQKWAAENPNKLNKGERVTNPQDYVFQEEKEIKPDVEQHYNAAFPEEERQAVHGDGGYNQKIQQGANLVYTLRNRNTGELAAAHILGVHDQLDPFPASQGIVRDFGNWLIGRQPPQLQSMHGDFIFVRDDLRSQGVGSYMYDLVVNAIKQRAAANGKHLVALTGEMEDPGEPAKGIMDAINGLRPGALKGDNTNDPIAWGRQLLDGIRANHPRIQDEDPTALGRSFMARYGVNDVAPEQAQTIGENLQMLDERIRRQEFYWALPTPKVDSGITWHIQDFNDPSYRGASHWTSVVFDPLRFAPRETGFAFMTDEAGYTLPSRLSEIFQYSRNNNVSLNDALARYRAVRQYMAENNYYRGSVIPAVMSSALLPPFNRTGM